MLVRLSRTKYAAWCDACLRGSEVVATRAPLVARFLAIESLRGEGWLHAPPPGLPKHAHEEAERSWSGATYCIDCASSERMRAADPRRRAYDTAR